MPIHPGNVKTKLLSFLATIPGRIRCWWSMLWQTARKHPFLTAVVILVLLSNRNFLFHSFVISILVMILPFLSDRKHRRSAWGIAVLIMIAVPGGPAMRVMVPRDETGNPLAKEQELADIHARFPLSGPLVFDFRTRGLNRNLESCGEPVRTRLWVYGWNLDQMDIKVEGLPELSRAMMNHDYTSKMRVDLKNPAPGQEADLMVTLSPGKGTPALLLGPETDGKSMFPEAVMLAVDTVNCRFAYHNRPRQDVPGSTYPQPVYKSREAGR